MEFVHLHTHTEYSLLDGVARIKDLCQACKNKGMSALAITDHGNMFGVIKFAEETTKMGIKGLIGCEMYACDNHTDRVRGYDHLVLICKNKKGYKNLVKLNSIAYVDGLYYKPRIDYKLLEQYKEGLICLSGCLQGRIPKLILNNEYEKAKEMAIYLKSLFNDDFYIELQDHGIADEKYVIPYLIQIAKEVGIKLVATNDVHYIEKEDKEIQDVALCIGEKTTLDDQTRKMRAYDNTYLKTPKEMLELFNYVPEAISNTVEIANKCDQTVFDLSIKYKKEEVNGKVIETIEEVKPLKDESLIPGYIPENGQTAKDYLHDLTMEGLKRKYKEVTKEILERAEYELTTINKMGFNEYFLIVWDFINYAKSVGIAVGPGRGSGAGSIVAYAIDITDVDPLRFSLFFERFLNVERVTMPDFDIDFEDARRGEVVEYVRNKYGSDKVAQIITFGTLKTKAAVKDVARVFNLSFQDVNSVTKLMDPNNSIYENLGLAKHKKHGDVGIKELKEIYDGNPQIKKVMDIASKLEDLPRNTSKHAAGVVICAKPIDENVPLQKTKEDITTQFDKVLVEEIGLLKMDFLGLITLSDLNKAYQYIKERHGVVLDFKELGYDDPDVYKYISSGKTMAVFQLENPGMTRFMKNLRPSNFEDIIAGISLYRPGPMDSIDDYVAAKHNPKLIHYAHPLLEPILKDTYGCIVYQEQVMQIVQDLGGFTLGRADLIRRAMSKKKEKEMLKNKGDFVKGCLERGVSKEAGEKVFDEMEKFASYAFNKSHATAYAVLSYQTAYVKMKYHNEFMTAILNNRITKIEEISKYLSYIKSENIPIYQPDVNKSNKDFSCEGDGIRVGLSAIKNVGEGVVEAIIKERERGEFKNFEDFIMRTFELGINKRLVESLILAGAFDSFKNNRSQLMAVYAMVMDKAAQKAKNTSSSQISMFGTLIPEDVGLNIVYPNIPEYDSKTKLINEKSVLGVYITGHPLSDFKEMYKSATFSTEHLSYYEINEDEKKIYTEITDGQQVLIWGLIRDIHRINLKNGSVMLAFSLEDLFGSIECVVYSNQIDRYKHLLVEDEMIKISGRLKIKEGLVSLIVDKAEEVKNPNTDVLEIPKEKEYLVLNLAEDKFSLEDDIFEVLLSYPGDTEVIMIYAGKKKKPSCKIRICEGILTELKVMLGEENATIRKVQLKS